MLELLHFSVGENNEAILTILTDAGREVLEIPERDIKAIMNMQASPPPQCCECCGLVLEYGYCFNLQCSEDAEVKNVHDDSL